MFCVWWSSMNVGGGTLPTGALCGQGPKAEEKCLSCAWVHPPPIHPGPRHHHGYKRRAHISGRSFSPLFVFFLNTGSFMLAYAQASDGQSHSACSHVWRGCCKRLPSEPQSKSMRQPCCEYPAAAAQLCGCVFARTVKEARMQWLEAAAMPCPSLHQVYWVASKSRDDPARSTAPHSMRL